MLKKMTDDFVLFVTKNPVYLLCSLAYYLFASWSLGSGIWAYIVILIVYVLSLAVVFSPLGEKLLRVLERARRVETNQERELLFPIFHEVCDELDQQQIKHEYLTICVIDKMTINACAMGKHTIAVTKGAMELFSANELKAIIAHEIAHILYLDTIARLYAMVGNGIYSLFFIVLRLIMFVADVIRSVESKSKGLALAFQLVRLFVDIIIFATMFMMQLAMSIGSRKTEYRADWFAFKMGYGKELVDALYMLEKVSLGDNSDLIERMTAKHPRITARIGRLEKLLAEEERAEAPYAPR